MKFITFIAVLAVVLNPIFSMERRAKKRSSTHVKSAVVASSGGLNPITHYSTPTGREILTLASYSYCDYDLMVKGKCCTKHQLKDYTVEYNGQIQKDKYTFAILKSVKQGRIVCTFTGTKGTLQLIDEGLNSDLVKYQYDSSGKIMLNRYFNDVFMEVREDLIRELKKVIAQHPTFQVIFTGHSLGAAVATIFATDSVINGYVKKTANSPCLFNYASPRVGNTHFALKAWDSIPYVFRVVRNRDTVARVPACKYFGKCKNKLGMIKFEKKYLSNNTPDETYWHVPGKILYAGDMKSFTNCGREYSERNPNEDCHNKLLGMPGRHTEYYQEKVSGLCKGAKQMFRYAL